MDKADASSCGLASDDPDSAVHPPDFRDAPLVERLLVAAIVVVAAALVALVLDRRRPDPPTQPRWAVPTQLDRADFARPDAPWLVLVFSSATCDACDGVLAKVRPLESDRVAVQEVEAVADAKLHRRYAIEAVPTLVMADADGEVRASFVGTPPAAELASALGAITDP